MRTRTLRSGVSLAASASLALMLASCASDDTARRALAETTTLRSQVDEVRQREEGNAREIARIQSQIRALESDAADRGREVRAASADLERARVLLEEARAALRERQEATAAPAPPSIPASPSISSAPPPAPTTPSSPPMPIAPLPEPAPAAPREVAAARTPSAAPEPAKPPSRPASSAEQLFGAAMANFRAQEHGQAVLELTDLITRFPTHSLAPAAQLWIGEAYYQQRDYRQTLVELKRVMDGYPKSPQVADALLKSGLCHRALGDRPSAGAAWDQVVRDYPASAAAGQARTLLGTRESAARGTR